MHEERLAEIIIAKLEQENPGFEFETIKVRGKDGNRLGIQIKNSYGLSPVVYVDQMFEKLRDGLSTYDIVELAADAFGRSIKSMVENEGVRDFIQSMQRNGIMDENLSGRLVSEEELSDSADDYMTLKVAEGLYLIIEAYKDVGDNMFYMLLPNNFFAEEERDAKIQVALDNLAKEAKLTNPEIGMDPPMYMLSNEGNSYGAACLFGTGIADGIASDLRSDYYILPGSKHEVFIVPIFDDDFDEEKLKALIVASNNNEDAIDQEDILTDRLYKYENGKIIIV